MKREVSLDIFKCISMYLVILCHTIQYFGEGYGVMDHPIGKFILILNMPMFIFISGYFSMSTYSRPLWVVVKSKFNVLFFPMLIFSILCYFITFYTPQSNLLQSMRDLLSALIYSYWFIWVALYSVFYMYLTIKVSKGSTWGILLSLVSSNILSSTFATAYTVTFLSCLSCTS